MASKENDYILSSIHIYSETPDGLHLFLPPVFFKLTEAPEQILTCELNAKILNARLAYVLLSHARILSHLTKLLTSHQHQKV